MQYTSTECTNIKSRGIKRYKGQTRHFLHTVWNNDSHLSAANQFNSSADPETQIRFCQKEKRILKKIFLTQKLAHIKCCFSSRETIEKLT